MLTRAQDAYQILHEVHAAILGLSPNLSYSQAAVSYGVRMEAAIALEVKFDQALASVQERFVCIHFFVCNFCKSKL